MPYTDPIYGTVDIPEPVLLDLMQTQAVHRLHGVLQHGVSALVGVTVPTSRFEHSMGVMLLVRRLGASLEEQIAALLHDVSHTALAMSSIMFSMGTKPRVTTKRRRSSMFRAPISPPRWQYTVTTGSILWMRNTFLC